MIKIEDDKVQRFWKYVVLICLLSAGGLLAISFSGYNLVTSKRNNAIRLNNGATLYSMLSTLDTSDLFDEFKIKYDKFFKF